MKASLLEEMARWEHVEVATQEATEAHRAMVEAINEANAARVVIEGEPGTSRL